MRKYVHKVLRRLLGLDDLEARIKRVEERVQQHADQFQALDASTPKRRFTAYYGGSYDS